MLDARRTKPCRRMFARWWLGTPVYLRDMILVELCLLPRGTASDAGWLRHDPKTATDVCGPTEGGGWHCRPWQCDRPTECLLS